jgi:hypothetical protein
VDDFLIVTPSPSTRCRQTSCLAGSSGGPLRRQKQRHPARHLSVRNGVITANPLVKPNARAPSPTIVVRARELCRVRPKPLDSPILMAPIEVGKASKVRVRTCLGTREEEGKHGPRQGDHHGTGDLPGRQNACRRIRRRRRRSPGGALPAVTCMHPPIWPATSWDLGNVACNGNRMQYPLQNSSCYRAQPREGNQCQIYPLSQP